MKKPRLKSFLWAIAFTLVVVAVVSPWILRGYWKMRSSNPVRRGVVHARALGCFSCHGDLGRSGIPIPESREGVPQWDQSVWMMYVTSEEDIRRYITDGSLNPDQAGHDAIQMPAYRDVLSDSELEDLVAAFKVLSGMTAPRRGTPERAGHDLARQWRCFDCHGPAGSGGLPNPGSFVGFVPGWYGSDFEDLVRDRDEFDTWILEGALPRLSSHPVAKRFLARQKIAMPSYPGLTGEELDNLWAYAKWLSETDGGHRAEIRQW